MDLDLIRDEIWRALGEPTDLDPDTDTTYNNGPLLTFVTNEAQRHVANWKDPVSGRHIRIRNLFATLYYSSTTVTDSIASSNNTTFPYTVTFTGSNVGSNDDQYNGWILEMTSGDEDGKLQIITDYVGSSLTATIHEVYGTGVAAADTCKLYKRFEYLLPSTDNWVAEHIQLPAESNNYRSEGNLIEVLKITDIAESRVLERALRTDNFPNFNLSHGDPNKWYRYGNRIFYDINVDEQKFFEVEYYRNPTEMSDATDEPELPEQFHYAIVLWGIWWGFKRSLETNMAYSAKKDFEDEMRRLKSQYDVQDERENNSIKLRGYNQK
jgi:hypothetical protein